MSNASQIETWEDALVAAKRRAKQIGFAYAVQWPTGNITCEDRKPSLRDQRFRVIEVDDTGLERLA